MVTHSDEGSFWSVVKKGAEQARQGRGRQAHLEPVQQRPAEGGAADRRRRLPEGRRARGVGAERGRDQGLAGRRPRRPASRSSRSTRAPTDFKALGRDHARRPGRERSPARPPARASRPTASRRSSASSTSRATSASQQRCDGVKQGFGGPVTNLQVKGTADIATTQTEIKSKLQADKSYDARHRAEPGHRRGRQDRDQGRELEREAGDLRPQPATSSRTSQPAT